MIKLHVSITICFWTVVEVLIKESSDNKDNSLEWVVTEKSGDVSQNNNDFGKSNIPNT